MDEDGSPFLGNGECRARLAASDNISGSVTDVGVLPVVPIPAASRNNDGVLLWVTNSPLAVWAAVCT